jgi:hypothetical protein
MNRLIELVDEALATAQNLDEAANHCTDKPVLQKRLRVAASTIRALKLKLDQPHLFNDPNNVQLKDLL